MYYSIGNGGDGSAFVKFFVSQLAADQHQELENVNEGWAEDCAGEVDEPKTDAQWLAEMRENLQVESTYHSNSAKCELLNKFVRSLEKKIK